MVVFKFVIIPILGFCLTSGILCQIDDKKDDQIWPSRLIGRVGLSVANFLLLSPSPLRNCIFTLPTGSTFDFSQGHNSTKVGEFDGYYGLGLAKGECGCSFEIANTSFEGVVTCKVRKVGNNEWIESASTLQVTAKGRKSLPSFEIVPRRASLQTGDYLNITCNAENRPLEVCRFILPDGTKVNFNRGPNSTITDEYRYLGTGLPDGKCGITLRVNAKHNGHILCKIGKKPLTTNGRWGMGVMVIQTKEKATLVSKTVTHSHSSPNVVRPVRKTISSRPKSTPAPPERDCGRNHLDPVRPHISGGKNAEQGEYPWHAGVYKVIGDKPSQQCGGTLISTTVVLTAAHCFVSEVTNKVGDASLYRIGLGKHFRDWNEDPDGKRVQLFKVKDIIIEPRYKGRKEKFQYDIAIVTLEKKAKITDFVDIICMDWDSSSKKLQLAKGKFGVATGWGATGENSASEVLQQVNLPWVSDSDCQAAVKEDAQPVNYYTEDKFCAGFRSQSTSVCKGDSGGGLFFMNSTTQRYFLRGITSVSFQISKVRGQCANQFYTGFTDVAQYIKEFIEPVVSRG